MTRNGTLLACCALGGALATGTVTVSAEIDVNSTLDSPRKAVPGDFDGDGLQDFAVPAFGTGVAWFRNLGSGRMEEQPMVSAEFFATDLEAVDLDADGDLDLVAPEKLGSSVYWWLNDGRGGFGTNSSAYIGSDPCTVAIGDVTGDGELDVVATLLMGGELAYLAGPDFASSRPTVVVKTQQNPWDVALGDFDGDDDLDIVLCEMNNAMVFYSNNGTGSFTKQQEFSNVKEPWRPTVGDADEDGDLDVFFEQDVFDGADVWLLVNNGTGYFEEPVTAASVEDPQGFTLADIDLDGHMDVTAATGTSQIIWFAGNGTATFAEGVSLAQFGSVDYPSAVAAFDADGDDKPDLVEVSDMSDTIRVLKIERD